MMYILYALIQLETGIAEVDMGLPPFETYEECVAAGVELEKAHENLKFAFCLDEVTGETK